MALTFDVAILRAAFSVAPRPSVCPSVHVSVRAVRPIFLKQKNHRNF